MAKRIEGIKIGLLNPLKIAVLSYGEVQNAKTYNALTQKPEFGGLFCQRIFGPLENWSCACGKHIKARDKKRTKCDICGVDITDSKKRKQRLGHISLAVPVVHIWFRRAISILLNIPPRKLDSVIQYENYIVLEPGQSNRKFLEVIAPMEYLSEKKTGLEAGIGAPAVKSLLKRLKLDDLISALRRQPSSRRINIRLQAAETIKRSGNRPEWMVLDTVLVMPPNIRPIIFMGDGTIASSDLNDLYAKVIHRNNRLKRFLMCQAPSFILTIEKKLLQAAVDALFDNGKRSLAKDRSNKRPLKSISDLLESKTGHLRKNLLGKRVDYSGRSVIVPGPHLELNQCGLPISLAMAIFKPFIYSRLIRIGYASCIKHAQALVRKETAEALEALEYEVAERVVLLNRAPTLHRMGFQAFYIVLEESEAIRLHPLVCAAFNADFDGDQVGVHLPLSVEAQVEASVLMLSLNNIISPAHGKPIMLPSQEIVVGIYYLTKEMDGCAGEGKIFSDKEDVIYAYEHEAVDIHTKLKVRIDGERVDTTAGRVIFSAVFPDDFPFPLINKTLNKKDLAAIISLFYEKYGNKQTALLLDRMKETGFKYATFSGISLCIDDICEPKEKEEIIKNAEKEVEEVNRQYNIGVFASDAERHNKVIDIWSKAVEQVTEKMIQNYSVGKEFNSLFMMADSGARGSVEQIRQAAGMRGLMAKPTGEIVEIPIKSSLKEGLSYFEYLLSCHGARKGRADGALKTATAGYFTRRLVFAAHDVIVNEKDCGTLQGLWVSSLYDGDNEIIPLSERIVGRALAKDVIEATTKEIIAHKGVLINKRLAKIIQDSGSLSVKVRSPFTCAASRGVCALCYGTDLSTWEIVPIGEAVGVIAAQSIGEPGTQLTLRSFHAGGSAQRFLVNSTLTAKESGTVSFNNIEIAENSDGKLVSLKRGLCFVSGREAGVVPYGSFLYVKEGQEVQAGQMLAEWDPYKEVVISTAEGEVEFTNIVEGVNMTEEVNAYTGIPQKVITSTRGVAPKIEVSGVEFTLGIGFVIMAKRAQQVKKGDILASIPLEALKSHDITQGLSRVLQILEGKRLTTPAMIANISGEVRIHERRGRFVPVEIITEDRTSKIKDIPADRRLNVHNGDFVRAGEAIADGVIDPRDVLRVLGAEKAAQFIVDEVQKVYKGQGVEIHDKHIEVIAKKMLGTVRVQKPGDTDFISGELVTLNRFIAINKKATSKATAERILTPLLHIPLFCDSFLLSASFQRTATVLTHAALRGSVDNLEGIKENIIIGNKIPVGTNHEAYRDTKLLQ